MGFVTLRVIVTLILTAVLIMQMLELDKHLSTLKTLSETSPELAKIVADLENGAAKARDLQVIFV